MHYVSVEELSFLKSISINNHSKKISVFRLHIHYKKIVSRFIV